MYGGARGGGKTDGMLGKFAIKAGRYGEHCIGVFFRRTREDLKEAVERSKQIYGPIGAKLTNNQWRFPNGARLKFEYLDKDKDADNYQGHSYTDVFMEELTHWPDPTPVKKLKATLRSAHGVPCQFHATCNPGGPGHLWVKHRYIDPAPKGWEIISEDFKNPFDGTTQTLKRVFIPSRLTDNRLLLDSDPMYVAKLQQSGSKELVRAWLEGDWDIVLGAFFDCWDAWKKRGGIVRPFPIPTHWTKFRSFDWGSARPFSVGWWAVASEFYEPLNIPQGAIIRYREWYGASDPNVGLKLDAEVVADGIVKRTAEDIHYSVADPAIFAVDGGPSIAERMADRGVVFWRGDNRRVGNVGHGVGWDQVRARFVGDERPMMYVFDTCTDFIRTMPALQHDELRPEDVDTDGEDHVADEVRYGCMSRPYTRPLPETRKDVIAEASKAPTFMQLMEESKRRRAYD